MTSMQSEQATPRALGPVRTVLESARQTLWMLRYRKLFWYAPIGLLLMSLFAYVVSGRAGDSAVGAHLYSVIAWWGLGTVLVPWMTLYLGVQAVHSVARGPRHCLQDSWHGKQVRFLASK